MIEPLPNCFSIARIAASTALPRSATAFSPFRSITAIVASLLSVRGGVRGRRAVRGDWSALVPVLFLPAWLALLPDELDVHRRLRKRLHLGQRGPVLGLLLRFAAGSV